MTDDASAPESKAAKPQLSERDRRLAEALRVNLRRRKAAVAPLEKRGDESSS